MKGNSKMATLAFDETLMDFRLAYLKDGPNDEFGACGFFWLGGFMSDMTGSKAESLGDLARATRRNCLRFDYSGHGKSSGAFVDGTISLWLEQATHMFLTHTRNRRIIVASSMGGWLALLLARRLMQEDETAFRRLGGMVLLAPAVDMTSALIWPKMTEEDREELLRDGVWHQPSDYGAPYPITWNLVEDGTRHGVLKDGLSLPFPVRILQGTDDADVPADHAVTSMAALRGDVTLTLIKGGDHRLATKPHLQLMRETALQLALRVDGVSV
jgi:pimeloyl-ACP methyl ester carboxylesterase